VKKSVYCLITVLWIIFNWINCDHNVTANRYYINSQTGNDANSGISIYSPWKSLKKLEEITFLPVNSILFAKNSVFQGEINFKSSGSAESPIVISNYGKGLAPTFSNSDQNKLNGNKFQISGNVIVIDGLLFANDNMGFLEIETNVAVNNIDVYYDLSDDYQQFILYWGGKNSKIENNTIIRTKPPLNGAVNTVFTMRTEHFTVRNNIFGVANGVQILRTTPYDVGNYDPVSHENNLYYCTDGSANDHCGQSFGRGEMIADSCFVNIDKGSYHLSLESPAIDKDVVSGYGLDLDNVVLVKNQIPDLGAYEKRIDHFNCI